MQWPAASTPREALNVRAVPHPDTGTGKGMAPGSARPFAAMGRKSPKNRAMMEIRLQATDVPQLKM
jgi:hypothetical protein